MTETNSESDRRIDRQTNGQTASKAVGLATARTCTALNTFARRCQEQEKQPQLKTATSS